MPIQTLGINYNFERRENVTCYEKSLISITAKKKSQIFWFSVHHGFILC